MAKFTVNSNRIDPYKNFKFCVKFEDGREVVGVSKVGGLKRTTEVVKHSEGTNQSTDMLSPGRSSYAAITLEQGLTHDREFETWANMVHNTNGDGAVSLFKFRRNIRIEVRNLQGTTVVAYNVFRAWVSEYQALPDLDANANAVAIISLTLQNEGWERDESIVEQKEF